MTAVTVALLLVVLIGMLSLSVDGGFLYLKYRGMRNANDAAALAAALSCAKGEGQAVADAQANDLAKRNVGDAVAVEPPLYTPSCNPDAGKVTVHYEGKQALFFSQVVGVGSPKPVGATATASWGLASGAARAAPLMLSMDRLTDCEIPYGMTKDDIGKTWCAFWWDNSTENLGNAAWGLMNLEQFNVSPTDHCSNAGESSYGDWLEFGFPGTLLMNDPPEPTYACRDSGNFGGAINNDIEKAIASGNKYAFPVNDPSKQVDSDGNVCPSPGCPRPDKYYIVGFAWLKLIGLYTHRDPEFSTYCSGFPEPDSNSRCLVAQWEGFTTSSLLGGGGATFGNMIAVTLSG